MRQLQSSVAGGILILAMMLWLAPFLVIDHSLPITTFFPELLAIVLSVSLFLLALLLQGIKRRKLTVPVVALAPTAFAVILFAQLAVTRDSRPIPIFLAIFFLVCVFLALQTGCWLGQDRKLARVVLCACAVGSLLGGLLSAGIAWVQTFGMESHYAGWIAEYNLLDHRRPFAHLFQPNHLSTVLCLSMFSALYLRQLKLIGSTLLAVAIFVLSIGVNLTTSRTSWLQIAVICVGSIAFAVVSRTVRATKYRDIPFTSLVGPSLLLIAIAIVTQLLVSWLNIKFDLRLSASTAARMAETDASSPRLQLWRYAIDIFVRHPLLGGGWGDFVRQQYLAADRLGQVEMANNAHNMVLDLLAKAGVLGAVAVLVPCSLWVVRVIRAIKIGEDSLNRIFCIVWVSIVFLHAMVEYPQSYAYFLLPICLIIGIAESEQWEGMTPSLSFSLAVATSMLVIIGAIAGYKDYEKIHVAYEPNGLIRYTSDPAFIFGDWGRFAMAGMMSLDKELLTEKIEMHENVIALAASPNYIRRYIILLALDGREEEALHQVERLRSLTAGRFDRQYSWLVNMCDETNGGLGDFKVQLLRTYGKPKPEMTFGG